MMDDVALEPAGTTIETGDVHTAQVVSPNVDAVEDRAGHVTQCHGIAE